MKKIAILERPCQIFHGTYLEKTFTMSGEYEITEMWSPKQKKSVPGVRVDKPTFRGLSLSVLKAITGKNLTIKEIPATLEECIDAAAAECIASPIKCAVMPKGGSMLVKKYAITVCRLINNTSVNL